jgi:hypothetical protein
MNPRLLLLLVGSATAAPVYRHKWDTVADMMAMHGQSANASDSILQFAATHYGQITTAAPCSKAEYAKGNTMEDLTLDVARGIKRANPAALVGMYWRTDFVGEIASCSNFTAELEATGNFSFLRDDNGNFALEHGHSVMWDYSNKPGVALFARALVNVVSQTLPNGKPILDYLYLDGPDWQDLPNISKARNAQLKADKMEFFADLQNQFDRLPGGSRGIILNGVDTAATAKSFNPTGVSGMMVDHFTILQFLLTGEPMNTDECNVKPPAVCGDFNVSAMDTLFELMRSKELSNVTVQVKGWVGPIIAQRDKWPPQMHTPADGSEKQAAMAERFNSELSFFLLVADSAMWWEYSWFWGFDSWIPAGMGDPDSNVPKDFFPQAKCALGPPAGAYVKGQKDTCVSSLHLSCPWLAQLPALNPRCTSPHCRYTRKFAHADVFVDLRNRTNSKVTFKGCKY